MTDKFYTSWQKLVPDSFWYPQVGAPPPPPRLSFPKRHSKKWQIDFISKQFEEIKLILRGVQNPGYF